MKYSIFLSSILSMGCLEKYRITGEVCNGSLYVEYYQTNPAGVDDVYLTDSSNFKIYLGSIDEGGQNYSVECAGDSVFIEKYDYKYHNSKETVQIFEKKIVSLTDLRSRHNFK